MNAGLRACRRLRLTQEFRLRELTGGSIKVTISMLPDGRADLGAGPHLIVILKPDPFLPGLTPSEEAVARALCDGVALAALADARGTSIETVKSQAKAVYAKLEVSGQVELMARFRS